MNVDELWVYWTEQRVRRQEKLVEEKLLRPHHLKTAAPPVPVSILTPKSATVPTSADIRKLLPHHTSYQDDTYCVVTKETSTLFRKQYLGSCSSVIGDGVFITAKQIKFLEEV